MDNQYLLDLIKEVNSHEGGVVLNMDGKPEAVVLSLGKYNELIQKSEILKMKSEKDREEIQNIKEIKSGAKDTVLVTGGAGYIGAHAVEELIRNGHEVVVVDNLSCGKRENVHEKAHFFEGDLGDVNFMRDIFAVHKIGAVMHFAASIEVAESVKQPVKYLQNNLVNTINLLNVMLEFEVKNIIFSSTCAVYGMHDSSKIKETDLVRPINPYGYSKLMAEKAIKYYSQYLGFKGIVFRYFNAAGCGADGKIKPTHKSHIIDNVLETALGNKACVEVYGNTHETFDGTGVRDYVHVCDIAKAHLEALRYFTEPFQVFNIGTGKGFSVLEIISTASEVLNKIIPMEIKDKRAGDAAMLVADNKKILETWGFKPAQSSMENIIQTAWRQKSKSMT